MNQSLHDTRFPQESGAYRTARDQLLKAEIELRRQIEAVATLRRALPLGGEVKEDYVFEQGNADLHAPDNAKQVRLSELFRNGKDNLIIYSFMYGPAMQQACPSCTSILDGWNGAVHHLLQRVNVAVVAKSAIERIREFARQRGWVNLPLLSSAHNRYNADYHGETADAKQIPMLNVFTRRDGRIYHTYGTELLFTPSEPGQDGRHVDMAWPLWNMLDYTPEGRGTDWRPKLSYDAA
ncbi:hypothetical protein GCM10007862_23530 [Dyella lipolytica]|uniref:DUF899 family protein n=1 Tax=Dyella lipolytica TaxID=1867835 RepID=A0ABW8IR38_9GAMM|nr:DUF899 family protein [Dyella lipolytica]GLQ47302.1 hypothetical protein GCM10007862_23530 [Dyella lipolytica]